MLKKTKTLIEETFSLTLNTNQTRVITRLVFEISRRDNISQNQVIIDLAASLSLSKYSPETKFLALRKQLTGLRFPITTKNQRINPAEIYLAEFKEPLKNNCQVSKNFVPLKVFVETAVKNSYILENIKRLFPKVEIVELEYYSTYLKNNKFKVEDLKKPMLFLTKEKWDFIKPCPCTKHHLRCGYWIFNLGFGCPFDCSYCFLEQYTNFPGIILPANIDDFFEKFDKFHDTLKTTIRLGTGEFCDSLALDHITEYSRKLIPYFAKKDKVIFELKTKSDNIGNVLKCAPSKNIVISWSVNPKDLSLTEELGAPSLTERLAAAKKVQDKGFSVAFHFDPIIHFQGWEQKYQSVVDEIYDTVTPPFSWISLGTLRSNRELKTVCEARFPKSNIFYGELLIGEDKKLRYPEFLRKEIYEKVFGWIRGRDKKTPVYLCMESKDTWRCIGEFDNTSQIESYIINR